MWLYWLLLIAATSEVCFCTMTKIRAHPTDHWFLDKHNRVSLFHGINAVTKEFPWYPSYLLNETRLNDLQDFGLNIVRLSCMWTGTEPNEGEYNETYIEILRDIIHDLGDRGIYSLLDMHQDGLSSRTGGYDGIPPWLYDSFPPPTNPFPWPHDEIEFWEQRYTTQACSEGFQMLYNNTVDALDKWADFWGYIAQQFRDEDYVIGYNYMNEPWIGDYFLDEELRLSSVAGRRNLMPSYDVLNENIRRYDSDTMVFYEPVMYGQLTMGDGVWMGSGFDRVPGDPIYQNVSAYSYHAYCWTLEFLDSNATDEDRIQAKEFCETDLIPDFLDSQAGTVNVTGGASMLTEFGLCKTSGDNINIECTTFMDLCDQYLQSFVEWDYSDFTWYDRDGNIYWDKIMPNIRAYARAIAGIPSLMFFNSSTFEFRLEYMTDPQIEQPTEIVVPTLRYPEGYDVEISPGLEWEAEGDIVKVYHNQGPDAVAREVEVKIYPRDENKDIWSVIYKSLSKAFGS